MTGAAREQEGTQRSTPPATLASSTGTLRRCLRSALLPTSMTTMSLLAWSRSSDSHCSQFSKVLCCSVE